MTVSTDDVAWRGRMLNMAECGRSIAARKAELGLPASQRGRQPHRALTRASQGD